MSETLEYKNKIACIMDLDICKKNIEAVSKKYVPNVDKGDR